MLTLNVIEKIKVSIIGIRNKYPTDWKAKINTDFILNHIITFVENLKAFTKVAMKVRSQNI